MIVSIPLFSCPIFNKYSESLRISLRASFPSSNSFLSCKYSYKYNATVGVFSISLDSMLKKSLSEVAWINLKYIIFLNITVFVVGLHFLYVPSSEATGTTYYSAHFKSPRAFFYFASMPVMAIFTLSIGISDCLQVYSLCQSPHSSKIFSVSLTSTNSATALHSVFFLS